MCYNYNGDGMERKIFKNLDEQIEIMRNKGLIINDEEKTKEILLNLKPIYEEYYGRIQR